MAQMAASINGPLRTVFLLFLFDRHSRSITLRHTLSPIGTSTCRYKDRVEVLVAAARLPTFTFALLFGDERRVVTPAVKPSTRAAPA